MTEPPSDRRSVRLIDAMPRPLMVVFVLASVVAVAAVAIVVIRPPVSDEVSLAERRPPPRAPYTHDPVEVFPAPTPDEAIPYDPPCPAVATAVPEGGLAFVRRVEDAFRLLCTATGKGVGEELRRSIAGLRDVTIRIAEFSRSGVESTADTEDRILYLNLKLTGRQTPMVQMIPPLVHDAWHLARPDVPSTAREELAARRAEAEACRQFIQVAEWPRWCRDAEALTTMPLSQAIALLADAGYRVSS